MQRILAILFCLFVSMSLCEIARSQQPKLEGKIVAEIGTDDSYSNDLYIYDLQSAKWTLLAHNIHFLSEVVWSPDKTKFAALYGKSNYYGPDMTFIRNTNGQLLSKIPGYCTDWSADDLLLGVRDTKDKREIFTVRSDGSNQKIIYRYTTSGHVAAVAHPIWSPDGERIAFINEIPVKRDFGTVPDYQLAMIDKDGTNFQVLVPSKIFPEGIESPFKYAFHNFVEIYWPEKGKIFLSTSGIFNTGDLYYLNLAMKELWKMPAITEAGGPDWSVKHQKLVYYVWQNYYDTIGDSISIANIIEDKVNGQKLTEVHGKDSGVGSPHWSTSGEEIAFTEYDKTMGPNSNRITIVDGLSGETIQTLNPPVPNSAFGYFQWIP